MHRQPGIVAERFRWAQLEPGHFEQQQSTADFGYLQFDRRAFSVGFKAEAEAREGTSLISVLGDAATDARWFGSRLGYGQLATSRGALDLTTAGPSSFYSVIVDKHELVAQFPETATLCGSMDEGSDVRLRDEPQRAGALRRFVRDALRDHHATTDSSVSLRANIRGTLLPMLAIAFEQAAGDDRPRSVTRRIAAVRLCEAYVNEHIDANPSLLDLSNISGLRLRSLINAFRAVTGLSPMSYLKRHRLNAVRHSLQKADKSRTRIIDVAANWGFWHMGHFTADYRALFGETPSETLRSA